MDFVTIILAALIIAAAAGGVAAYYKKSAGQDALDIAQRTIALQNEERDMLVRKNSALQGQLDTANSVIERLTKNGNSHSSRTKG